MKGQGKKKGPGRIKCREYIGQRLMPGETLIRIRPRGEPDQVVICQAKDAPPGAGFGPEKLKKQLRTEGPGVSRGFKRITPKMPKLR